MQIQNVLHVGKYKCAAVMICLYEEDGEQYIVLEKRANGIRQGGEISLPGGKRDLRDVDFKMTAIRETSEELGILKEKIEYIGYAGTLVGIFDLLLDVHLCKLTIEKKEEFRYNKKEVEYLIFLPLSYLETTEPVREIAELKNIPKFDVRAYGLPSRYWDTWPYYERNLYFYFYEGEVIWGITAEILLAWIRGKKKGKR
ncbi:NUDIX hydrolase [Fusobacterium necrophorum]|uniref:Phosphohydrolase n=2 Tax=Fusobacterium necrophorum TaxID=859 RepID=A0AB73C4Q6_9FUSO|nr:CoA pyrophosphatase [Fusobacterium necrophorum]KDE73061.1 phosphohydrolase [Fusobacterium necrophorum DJ-2]MCF0161818.1 CoA pyrophosphatase [Fusobacterium necrophorum]